MVGRARVLKRVLSLPPPLSLPLSPSPSSREFRFQLTPSLSLSDVVAEIRRHTDMSKDTPFNLKWLDVEGEWRVEGEGGG